MATFNGWEIVKNGDWEVVVVEMQYRLGVFGQFAASRLSPIFSHFMAGFLAGQEMKDKGALNAGLC